MESQMNNVITYSKGSCKLFTQEIVLGTYAYLFGSTRMIHPLYFTSSSVYRYPVIAITRTIQNPHSQKLSSVGISPALI